MCPSSESFDVLLVGGGVIGLSIAWELAQHGARICVADCREMGREASWAAAGMLPPGPRQENWPRCQAFDQLAGLSEPLHQAWHEKLLNTTGIDNGFRLTGAIYLEDEKISEKLQAWDHWGTPYHRLDAIALADLEPNLAQVQNGVLLPSEAQLNSPRHLEALESVCLKSNVVLKPHCQITGFEKTGSRLTAALTSDSRINADQFCLTTGCWTQQLGLSLELTLPMRPVRGQIVQLDGPRIVLQRIVNCGPRYLLPRPDGTVLVGSTQEEVGFDQGTTREAREQLLEFAYGLCPQLCEFKVVQHWAGLRPGTPDELPYLGKLPTWENAWIASGHFRSGIQLSTGTAVVMRSLLMKQQAPVDIATLSVTRSNAA